MSHAEPDLFSRHPYVLTSRDAELEQWVKRIGARLVIIGPGGARSSGRVDLASAAADLAR